MSGMPLTTRDGSNNRLFFSSCGATYDSYEMHSRSRRLNAGVAVGCVGSVVRWAGRSASCSGDWTIYGREGTGCGAGRGFH